MIALFSRNSLVVSLFALSSIMSCVWPERVVKYKTWLIFSDVNIWSRVIIGRCLLFIDLLFWVTGTLLPVLCLFLCRESWLVSVSIRLSVKQMIVYLLFTYVTSMCLAAHCLSVCLPVCHWKMWEWQIWTQVEGLENVSYIFYPVCVGSRFVIASTCLSWTLLR